MKKFIIYTVCFAFVIPITIVFAEIKSLIKEYTYLASDLDSKTSCRAIALEQVKRELLEELGTYVQASTVVQDYRIEKDEIKTLTGGVVQTKILDEKWDGKEYWLKAQVSADPDEVAASIEKIKNDDQLAQELAESKAEKEEALKEVDRLKSELAQANADKAKQDQYNLAVNQLQASDSFEQGTALTVAGNYEEAAKAYDHAISLQPDDAKSYFNRSIVYINLGNYNQATYDLDRAMLLQPANTNSYFQRATAYKNIRETKIARQTQGAQPLISRPSRTAVSGRDPLQRFLDRKQAQHQLVTVNPFRPRTLILRGEDKSRQQRLQKKEAYIVRQPVKPDRKALTAAPQAREDKRQLSAKPRVEGPQKRIQKKELTEEQKKKLRKQKKEREEEERAKHHRFKAD